MSEVLESLYEFEYMVAWTDKEGKHWKECKGFDERADFIQSLLGAGVMPENVMTFEMFHEEGQIYYHNNQLPSVKVEWVKEGEDGGFTIAPVRYAGEIAAFKALEGYQVALVVSESEE